MEEISFLDAWDLDLACQEFHSTDEISPRGCRASEKLGDGAGAEDDAVAQMAVPKSLLKSVSAAGTSKSASDAALIVQGPVIRSTSGCILPTRRADATARPRRPFSSPGLRTPLSPGAGCRAPSAAACTIDRRPSATPAQVLGCGDAFQEMKELFWSTTGTAHSRRCKSASAVGDRQAEERWLAGAKANARSLADFETQR